MVLLSFVLPLNVGSTSDVELTCISGHLEQLKCTSNISGMADHVLTQFVTSIYTAFRADLNIPAFLEGWARLPAPEVLEGCNISSVRVHIQRVIGKIDYFSILKGSLPNTLSRVNFQPVLIPPPVECKDNDVESTFNPLHIRFRLWSRFWAKRWWHVIIITLV